MTLELVNAMQIGLIHSLVALGVYLTFRVIDFADLTVDGSYMFGAALTASLIASGLNPLLATIASLVGGGICGVATAYLNVRWNILSLLCGILVMIFLYSVNLRIMGKPNIVLMDEATLFNKFDVDPTSFLFIIVFLISIFIIFFLFTDYGLGIRAVGINKKMSEANGVSANKMVFIVLAMSNSLVALSGSFFTQLYGYADISMGTGIITIGLASVIIGEKLLSSQKFYINLISCILGAIFFRVVITLSLNSSTLGLKSSDLNAITSLLVVAAIISSRIRKKRNYSKNIKEGLSKVFEQLQNKPTSLGKRGRGGC